MQCSRPTRIEQLKKNVPEFEELAAMQAGFWVRPIIARRDGTQEAARSVMGEFVSGNYFRTFGLQPRAGRLLMDADDTQGAPMTAVMSYEAWQRNYAGDASVVGSTFWMNTKPVTVVGIAPKGFYGDRLSITPPEFYLPIETMPVLANVPVRSRSESGLALHYRAHQAGSGDRSAARKGEQLCCGRHSQRTRSFHRSRDKTLLAKVHVVLTPGGAGIQAMQEWYGSKLHLLMWIAGLVLLIACANIANLLLVRGMGTARGDLNARCAGRHARKNHPSIAYGKYRAGRNGRYRRTRRRLCGSAHAADAGFPGSTKHSDPRQPVALGSGVRVWSVAADRDSLRRGAGVDCSAGRADRRAAKRHANDGGRSFSSAAWTGGGSGWTVAGAAGWGRACSCRA